MSSSYQSICSLSEKEIKLSESIFIKRKFVSVFFAKRIVPGSTSTIFAVVPFVSKANFLPLNTSAKTVVDDNCGILAIKAVKELVTNSVENPFTVLAKFPNCVPSAAILCDNAFISFSISV